jgi:hypothetical protein
MSTSMPISTFMSMHFRSMFMFKLCLSHVNVHVHAHIWVHVQVHVHMLFRKLETDRSAWTWTSTWTQTSTTTSTSTRTCTRTRTWTRKFKDSDPEYQISVKKCNPMSDIMSDLERSAIGGSFIRSGFTYNVRQQFHTLWPQRLGVQYICMESHYILFNLVDELLLLYGS